MPIILRGRKQKQKAPQYVYEKGLGSEFAACGDLAILVLFHYTVATEVNVNVKFTLEQATKAKRGSKDMALLFL